VTRVRPAAWGVGVRPATDDDLPVCGEIWRDALNDYMARLGEPPVGEDLAPIGRLHAHLRATDPDGFWVAARDRHVIGFAASVARGRVRFLSMLFVRPGEQGAGVGPMLLERVLPLDEGGIRATATDSAQPIANALYARLGVVPRLPLLSMVGRPTDWTALPGLPDGVEAVTFESIAAGPPEGPGQAELATAVDALDRDAVGFEHPADHAFLRREGRQGFLYRGPDNEPLGYGYTSKVGRVGPVAVADAALTASVLGHLLGAIEPRGAWAVWVPGAAGPAVSALLAAGMRLEGFPVLLCWDRPFADFERYLPISPGLL
jgi:GNAT superfamily N-acetyltransferase